MSRLQNRSSLQQGFSLIELMIALSITSVLIMSIFGVIRQIRIAVRQVGITIEKDIIIAAFGDQLERDVMGMFSPAIVQQELKSVPPATPAPTPPAPSPGEPVTDKKIDQKPEDKAAGNKEQLKKWEPVYVVEKSDKGLLWSFITTGGLATITAKGQVLTQPLVRRVLYKLEPQEENTKIFRLLYSYAVDDLDFNKLKSKPREQYYELARNITDFALEQTVFELVDKEQGQDKQAKQPSKAAVLQTWNADEIKQKYKTVVPAFIKISGALTQISTGQQTPFVFEFAVPAYEFIAPKTKN